MRLPRLTAAAALTLVAALAAPARATVPWPNPGGNPYDYTRLHIQNGSCEFAPGEGGPRPAGTDLPPNFDCRSESKLTDYAAQPGDDDYDPAVASNPQELFGRKGAGTNRAWEITTGRPDTVIAVLDSGILWFQDTPELVDKFALNRDELPVPGTDHHGANGRDYDVNHDGVFNMADYAADARVVDSTTDQNDYKDPADLIRAYSDGVDDDGNGYVDDISGWDFYEGDNDAGDDVTYGHGTGESRDSAAEVDKQITQCPNCMLLEMRVGDSFVADINHFAEAVVYAVDNGASVVQEALGTVNHTRFAQTAVDYAYNHGVLVVASEADESAGHHNYPAALSHTMVVNSVTHFAEEGGVALQAPKTYLAFNGCTNFGGYSWTTIESNSCSSDATGQAAGIAGLLYSAARNAGITLSAEEAKQLFRVAADDIDFSSPKLPFGPPNNFATTLPASQRFVTTAGWDQVTGWGRESADRLVHLAAAGQIPPEADITGPAWWAPLGVTGQVPVRGRVAAPRAASYTYEVQVAPGVQPPRWPLADSWTVVASGSGSQPKRGVLASIDLAQVRALIDAAPAPYTPADDPTSRDLPERDAFRVRVVVHADGDTATPWKTAIAQRQLFAHADPALLPGFPRPLRADGAGSPVFADIDGDGANELLIADGNGFVHAFEAGGGEAPGWPVHTDPLPLPDAPGLPRTVYAPLLLGSPAVADLDGDGRPEVSVADVEGALYVWHQDGSRAAGFPVHSNPAFSAAEVHDHINTVDHAFSAAPSIGDLDRTYAGLEVVAGSMDGHVYAWHADGTAVPGWPVLLRDPDKVATVDPLNHKTTFEPDANVAYGRQVITTPSLGDVDGDGELDVAVNVDEEYEDPPNISADRDPGVAALGLAADPGNTRVYLLFHDGTNHPGTERVPHLGDNAYQPGWPVAIYMVQTELLPDVGSGSDGAPVIADVDGDGLAEIATASIGTPPYLLRADGTSFYGDGSDGKPLVMASSPAEFKGVATDGPSLASLGGGAIGRLAGADSPLSFAMGATGLRRLLDVVLPEQQLGAEDHIGAWDMTTGTYMPGFPALMNDLQFFNTPAIADIDGDGLAEVLQSSAVYDLRAYSLGGTVPSSWPKFTAGWSVSTPAVGEFGGTQAVALATREGNLFVWRTAGSACSGQEWPGYQHDLRNSGSYATDGTPPGPVGGAFVSAGRVLSFDAPGDDGRCGTADHYAASVDGAPAGDLPAPGPAGTRQTITLPAGAHAVTLQAVDDAGNAGFPVTLSR